MVMGMPVRLSPAKITTPMLSFSRPSMNLMAISLAASMRSGFRSRASMELDTSRAITMSVPSVDDVCQLSFICGRARMMISTPMAARRSTKMLWRSMARSGIFDPLNGSSEDTPIVGLALRCLSRYHAMSGTITRNSHKY